MPGDFERLGDARRLVAGDLEAVFLPGRGMLGASLRHHGVELLRRVGDLETAAAKGSTAGIPFLHPWANRLEAWRYRAAGRAVVLDRASPLLHADGNGLPIHGVPWAHLSWEVVDAGASRIRARLSWDWPALLAVFPFPHVVEIEAALSPEALAVTTTLTAGPEGPVPVSFGFHPYLGIPDAPRAAWRLELPAMRRLRLDGRGIPDGGEEPFTAFDAPLGARVFDDGFAVAAPHAAFVVSGAGRRIAVELLEGFRFAQVYAPAADALLALEPMTAPTDALVSGRGLTLVSPGERFRAAFRIGVSS
ncbi:MAG TPA: aldose 1-epimerase [Thermoanaerobaculia bacterium]|nr:aldose 1-epimerase [Thermoanaerobaculia bacterium]